MHPVNRVSGLKPDSVEWTARRRTDGSWAVALTYASRGGRRSASWLWQPAVHDLTPLDLAASRLSADDVAPARGRKSAATAKPEATLKAGK